MTTDAPVLVVDDDEASLELMRRFLQRLRLVNPFLSFSDGSAAGEYLVAAGAARAPVPALALFDLRMPRTTGFALLEIVRGHFLEGRFPVVMLTGSSELADLDRAYALGASSYLVKPVGYEALGHVLRSLDTPWALTPA